MVVEARRPYDRLASKPMSDATSAVLNTYTSSATAFKQLTPAPSHATVKPAGKFAVSVSVPLPRTTPLTYSFVLDPLRTTARWNHLPMGGVKSVETDFSAPPPFFVAR